MTAKTNKPRKVHKRKPKKRDLKPGDYAGFAQLQKEWYDYLAYKGFEDLEWVDNKTGVGQGSPYLQSRTNKMSGYFTARYTEDAENYYIACHHYITHNSFKTALHKYIFTLHADGIVYRDIKKQLAKDKGKFNLKRVPSIFWLHTEIQTIIKAMLHWNKTDPNGTLHNSSDAYIKDMMLREPDSYDDF